MSHRCIDTVKRHATALARLSIFASVGLGISSVAVTPVAARAPTGDFAAFAQCPRFTAGVEACVYDTAPSGEMVLGRRTIPIGSPVTLQGGWSRNERVIPPREIFFGALNGETLVKAPQKLPGGLLGLPLLATLELVEPAGEIRFSKENFENREGAALSLLVRIHLESSFLGPACFIGSPRQPLVVNLTTGTTKPNAPNKPISGRVGIISARDEFNLVEASSSALVDNAFAAPEATGCGPSGTSSLVDRLIDENIGLPSPDGRNTLVMDGVIKFATAEGVIASEVG